MDKYVYYIEVATAKEAVDKAHFISRFMKKRGKSLKRTLTGLGIAFTEKDGKITVAEADMTPKLLKRFEPLLNGFDKLYELGYLRRFIKANNNDK
jgi:hypothetical protein